MMYSVNETYDEDLRDSSQRFTNEDQADFAGNEDSNDSNTDEK